MIRIEMSFCWRTVCYKAVELHPIHCLGVASDLGAKYMHLCVPDVPKNSSWNFPIHTFTTPFRVSVLL